LRRYGTAEVEDDEEEDDEEGDGGGDDELDEVGRCRMTVSKPVLKALMVSALDRIS